MRGNAAARQAQLQAQLGPSCDVAVQPVRGEHRLRYTLSCRDLTCHWWADGGRPVPIIESWLAHEAEHRVKLRAQMIAAGMRG